MATVLGILCRPDPLGHCRNTPACPMHVPPMYYACTWLAPPNPLPSTWLVPGLHHACTWLWFPFCIHHSSFILHFWVALGSHWGSLGVALGWLWGAYRLATNTLWGGFDVALMWLWGGLGRRLNRGLPGTLHSALYLCPSVGVADGKSWPTAYEADNRWRRSGRRLASRPHSQ